MQTDLEIQKNVEAELKSSPILASDTIGVIVKSGIVELNGTLDLYNKLITAEELAERIVGVRAVDNEIEINLSEDVKRSDNDIADVVLNILKWHSLVPAEQVSIKVEKAWITLDGEVEWEFQKQFITKAIESLIGIRGITNFIRIAPQTLSSDVLGNINAALNRSASIDPEKIKIEIHANRAIILGRVRSLAEKHYVENVVWANRGICFVENKLEVNTEEYAY